MNYRFTFTFIFLTAILSLYSTEKHDKFVVVTPPKAGTHLLTKAVEQLTLMQCHNIFSTYHLTKEEWTKELQKAERTHQFIQIHGRPYPDQIKNLKNLGYKVLFLVRDPRDQAISLFFFIEQKNWYLGPLRLDREPYRSLSKEDKLHEIITGKRTGYSAVEKLFSAYLPWSMQDPRFVLTTRFEDLVGEDGGGSRMLQLHAVTKIAKFLNMTLTPQQIDEHSRDLFGTPGVKTFRKGQIGGWRQHFTSIHRQAIQKRFGHLMDLVGYSDKD